MLTFWKGIFMADQVKAFPAKRFFVEMLTRDIELKDSLLDLLDNCIDGVMREKKEIWMNLNPTLVTKRELLLTKTNSR